MQIVVGIGPLMDLNIGDIRELEPSSLQPSSSELLTQSDVSSQRRFIEDIRVIHQKVGEIADIRFGKLRARRGRKLLRDFSVRPLPIKKLEQLPLFRR